MTGKNIQQEARNLWWVDALFITLILIICAVATYPQLKVGDFPSHIIWAQELAERNYVLRPNILYQQLVVIVKTLIPYHIINRYTNNALEYYHAWYYRLPAFIVTLAGYLWTALLLKQRFAKLINPEVRHRQTWIWLAVLACMIASPILLFTLRSRLIIGYIKPNVWHNPTFSLLKPFALWIFFFILDHWNQQLSLKQWFSLALMTSLSILAKPNFILSFLPAFALLLLIQIRSIKNLPWGILSAMIIPAGLTLLYQYLVMYSMNAENQIYLIPFKAALYSAGSAVNMVIFYLLSVLFPLQLSISTFKNVSKQFDFQLVWLNFAIALLTWILFVELPHMTSLDFMWGPNLGLFLLFVYAIGWLLQNPRWLKQKSWQSAFSILAISLHVISGIVYTVITLVKPGPVR